MHIHVYTLAGIKSFFEKPQKQNTYINNQAGKRNQKMQCCKARCYIKRAVTTVQYKYNISGPDLTTTSDAMLTTTTIIVVATIKAVMTVELTMFGLTLAV